MTVSNGTERIDDLGRKGYRILSRTDLFCFGVDAAFLAWYAHCPTGGKVLDLCSGNGIVPILMDARLEEGQNVSFTGIEYFEASVTLAVRSAELNGLEDHMTFIQGDIKETDHLVKKASFDTVTVNPPYFRVGAGILNPGDVKAAARHEVLCTLKDVVRAAAVSLKDGGTLYMIHRPNRLTEIMACLEEEKLSPSDLTFIHPYRDREASMVLVTAVRGRHRELHVSCPVVIYEKENVYTEQVKKIYGL